MKPSHTIFFAIPFDAATKEMYERVSNELKGPYPTLKTVIGTKEVKRSEPSSDIQYSDIAIFKAQYSDLHHQFKSQIENADVIVADLTNNNPNVHVELGIALRHKRNRNECRHNCTLHEHAPRSG